jgi:tetratricopeptide (TPR) repeat protein
MRELLVRTISVVAIVGGSLTSKLYAQDAVGCRKGALPAVTAYMVSNPFYSRFLGDFETFVIENAAQFRAGGDAVRCLSALSTAFLQASVSLYDPREQRSRDSLNTEIQVITGNRGPQESTPGTAMLGLSRRMARLARGLPAAAQGDWEVYNTPVDELGRMEIFAEQLFQGMMRDGTMRDAMIQVQPLLKQLAAIDLVATLRMATSIGEQSCAVTPNEADCIFRVASRAVERGEFAIASAAFTRMRAAAPSDEALRVNEGITWYKAGQIAHAEQATRRALVVNASSYQAHDNLGFILFDRGRYAEALTHFDAALQVRPGEADALAGKAIALLRLGRITEAAQFYRRAVQLEDRFLDCAELRKRSYWSQIACDAAAPLIRQVR